MLEFEKRLRYPGHVDQMRIFSNTGLLSQSQFQVKGVSVRPIDVTASLLSPLWEYGPGKVDVTVMKLIISGEENGKPITYTCDLYDEYDPPTSTPSMARTTGYTCTAVAQLVLNSVYSQRGISPPEFVGRFGGCRERVEQYLEERGVRYSLKRS